MSDSLRKIVLLDAVTSTGAGTAANLDSLTRKNSDKCVIQVYGISGDTVIIEGSFDNVNYSPVDGGTIVKDTCVTLNTAIHYIRANVTTRSAGTITALLGV